MNLLRGEVGLVGSQPLVVVEDKRGQGWYRQQPMLTAAMAAWWQILRFARVRLSELVKLDDLHVACGSAWTGVNLFPETALFVAVRSRP